jgi:flagellar assembly factor FliW
MNIQGTRFATIEYEPEDVIAVPDGLVGFPQSRRFLLVSNKEGSPFRWLQSLDVPELAFLLADPGGFGLSYNPEFPDWVAGALALEADTPALMFTTAAIPPGAPRDLTLNLAAPIVINALTRTGMQVVLDDPAYTMRYRVFDETSPQGEGVAA